MLMRNKKIIIVTGSNGFIGQNLISKFLTMNLEVYAFSRSIKKRIEPNLHEINIDLNQKLEVTNLIEKIQPDAIIHLAYDWSDYQFTESHIPNNIGNLNMTLNILDACYLLRHIPKFINIGSCEEYGNTEIPFNETLCPNPITNYGKTKLLISEKIQNYSDENKINGVTLRTSVVYGNNQNGEMLIPYTVSNLLNRKPVKILHGDDTRDFIHVQDVVDAVILAFESSLKFSGDIINIASGESMVVKDLVKLIVDFVDPNFEDLLEISLTQKDTAHIKNYYVDIKKAAQILKWQPRIELKEGLRQLVKFKTSGVQ